MQISTQVKKLSDSVYDLQIQVAGRSVFLVQIERQAWDSEVLGMETGRLLEFHSLDPQVGTPQGVFAGIPAELNQLGLRYVTVRRPQGEWAYLHELERAGFALIDVVVEYAKDLEPQPAPTLPSAYTFRLADAADIERVSELAKVTFTLSRFHNDPLLSRLQCDRVHAEWVKNSCLGRIAHAVWLIEVGSRVAGFITCKIKDKTGVIDLVAVARSEAGRGLGRALLAQAEHWFASRGCQEVQVQTQANNYAALGLYSSQDYRIRLTQTTLRWAAR